MILTEELEIAIKKIDSALMDIEKERIPIIEGYSLEEYIKQLELIHIQEKLHDILYVVIKEELVKRELNSLDPDCPIVHKFFVDFGGTDDAQVIAEFRKEHKVK